MLIGVVSDSHGVFNPAIREYLQGVTQILHAGDIGKAEVLDRLEQIAPVVTVTGNVDWGGALDRRFPRVQRLTIGGCAIYMTHIGGLPAEMQGRLPVPPPDVFTCGHSHIPLLERSGGVLFLNPGSIGPPRFGRRPSLALLRIDAGQTSAEIIHL